MKCARGARKVRARFARTTVSQCRDDFYVNLIMHLGKNAVM